MTPENANRPYQDIVSFLLEQLTATGVITDTAPGGVARTIVEATAREFAQAYAQMNAVYEAGFVDTATGASLDQLVAILGLTRIDGEAATSEIRVLRDSRISARVIVPKGALIAINRASQDKVIYETDDTYELSEGEASRIVGIRSVPVEGQPSADLAFTADDVALQAASFVRPIAGIAAVELIEPTIILGISETDEELRVRAKGAIAAAGGGTEKAIEDALLAIDEVKSVRLRDAGDPVDGIVLDPGELEVILDVGDADLSADAELLARIETAILDSKGPGILPRLRVTENVTLSGLIKLRPTSEGLTGEQILTLISDAEAVLAGEVEGLDIGNGLVWNRLLASLMGVENVGDVLVAGSEFVVNGAPAPIGDIPVEKTERLVLGTGEEAPIVALEQAAKVIVSPRVTMTIADPGTSAGPTMVNELNTVAAAYLAELNGQAAPVSVSTAELITRISTGVATLVDAIETSLTQIDVLHTVEASTVTLGATTAPLTFDEGVVFQLDPAGFTVEWVAP